MLQLPNRVAQAGVYYTGTPNYVDLSGVASSGMVTFQAMATADSWTDNDTVGVLVVMDAANYWVGIGTWDETNEYIELTTEEEAVGTLTDSAAVTISSVLTSAGVETLRTAIADAATLALSAELQEESTTARTLTAADHGQRIRCTNGSATTITLDDALPVGFHAWVIQEGAGAVSIAIEGTDTVNGGTSPIAVSGQWGSAYVYQPSEGAWVVIA